MRARAFAMYCICLAIARRIFQKINDRWTISNRLSKTVKSLVKFEATSRIQHSRKDAKASTAGNIWITIILRQQIHNSSRMHYLLLMHITFVELNGRERPAFKLLIFWRKFVSHFGEIFSPFFFCILWHRAGIINFGCGCYTLLIEFSAQLTRAKRLMWSYRF